MLTARDMVVTVKRVGPDWDQYGQRDTYTTDEVWDAVLWKVGGRRALVRRRRRFVFPRFNGRRWTYRLVRIHEAEAAPVEKESVF